MHRHACFWCGNEFETPYNKRQFTDFEAFCSKRCALLYKMALSDSRRDSKFESKKFIQHIADGYNLHGSIIA